MSTREEQARILLEIERDLRRGDRLLPARFAFVRTRAALHRTAARVLIASEAALFALVLLGELLRMPALFIPAAGAALIVPLIAVPWNTQPNDAGRRAPSPPRRS